MQSSQVSASLLLSSYLGKEHEKIGKEISHSDFAGELQKFLPASGKETASGNAQRQVKPSRAARTNAGAAPAEKTQESPKPADTASKQTDTAERTAANQSEAAPKDAPAPQGDATDPTSQNAPQSPANAQAPEAPAAPEKSGTQKTDARTHIAQLKTRAKNARQLYIPDPMVAETILTKLHYPAETIKACKALQTNGQISLKDFKALLDGATPSVSAGNQEQIPASQVNAILVSLISKSSNSGQATVKFADGLPAGLNIKTSGSYTADQVRELVDKILQQPVENPAQTGLTDASSDNVQITGQTAISPKSGQTQSMTTFSLPSFLSDDSDPLNNKPDAGDGKQDAFGVKEKTADAAKKVDNSVADRLKDMVEADKQTLSTPDEKELTSVSEPPKPEQGQDYAAPTVLADMAAQATAQPEVISFAQAAPSSATQAAVLKAPTSGAPPANTEVPAPSVSTTAAQAPVSAADAAAHQAQVSDVNAAAPQAPTANKPVASKPAATVSASASSSGTTQANKTKAESAAEVFTSSSSAGTTETAASTVTQNQLSGLDAPAEKLASMIEELNARTVSTSVEHAEAGTKTAQNSLSEGSVLHNMTVLAKETEKQSTERLDASQFPGLHNEVSPFQESRIAMPNIQTSLGQNQTQQYDPNRMVELVQNYQEQARSGSGQLVLEMDQQEFGKMSIKVQTKKDEVSAVVMTENEPARQALLKNTPELRADFQDQGMVLGKFMVDVDGRKAGEGRNPEWGKQEGKTTGSGSAPKVRNVSEKPRTAPVYPQTNNGQHSLSIFA